jgi:DNA-directed RNA polymerase subunit RPC12/RpoP
MKPQNVQCRKTLLGKYEVTYDCPGCGESLKNDLDDAGKNDQCPHCECKFVVPGSGYKREVERRRTERIAEKEARKRESEAKAREAEEKLRETEAKAREVEAKWKREIALKEKENQIKNANQNKPADNKTAIQYISEGLSELVRALYYSFLAGLFSVIAFFFGSMGANASEDIKPILFLFAAAFALLSVGYVGALYFTITGSIESFEKGSRA